MKTATRTQSKADEIIEFLRKLPNLTNDTLQLAMSSKINPVLEWGCDWIDVAPIVPAATCKIENINSWWEDQEPGYVYPLYDIRLYKATVCAAPPALARPADTKVVYLLIDESTPGKIGENEAKILGVYNSPNDTRITEIVKKYQED